MKNPVLRLPVRENVFGSQAVALELAHIFRQYGSAYRQKYAARLLPSHRRTMTAIERCRTEALGGQVYSCSACGEVRYSYHSCRNRHCPKCPHEQAQEWLQLQQKLLLRVPYFLLTFTLSPHNCASLPAETRSSSITRCSYLLTLLPVEEEQEFQTNFEWHQKETFLSE